MATTMPGARFPQSDPVLVLDHLPVQVWQLSDEQTYGPVNAAHAAFVGRGKDELTGLRLEQIFDPEVAEACRISNRDTLSSSTPITVEEWVQDCRGVPRLLSITKSRIPAADGGAVGILCVGLDITEQRAAEARLAQSEANFRTLIETIDDLVVIGDPNGQLRYVNPATRHKLGYSNEEILGLNILDLHPTWVQHEAKSIITEMFAGRRQSCPLPLVSKRGNLLPVETRIWFGKWDGQDCVFGLSLDLSREQESLQKFEKLFRRNPALMAITDVETRRFVDVNDTFLRAMGYTADEVLGKTPGELNMFPGRDEQARVADLLETYGKLEEFELFARTRDGSVLTGLFSGELIESQGKTVFLTVMLDITERKRAAEERELIIMELKAALAQIKTLRGIFPICAKCKKIRDDKGYWQQVEAYISQRTDAHFSHGLCPHCMELLYPEYLEDPPLPDKD